MNLAEFLTILSTGIFGEGISYDKIGSKWLLKKLMRIVSLLQKKSPGLLPRLYAMWFT
jgi:hypothetical protein